MAAIYDAMLAPGAQRGVEQAALLRRWEAGSALEHLGVVVGAHVIQFHGPSVSAPAACARDRLRRRCCIYAHTSCDDRCGPGHGALSFWNSGQIVPATRP